MGSLRLARTHQAWGEPSGGNTRAETLGEFLTELHRTTVGLAQAYDVAASRAADGEPAEQFRVHARDFRIHADDLLRCLDQVEPGRSEADPTSQMDGDIPAGVRGLALATLLQAREDALATRYQWFLREGPWRVELHVCAVLQLGLSLALIHRSWLLLQRARLQPAIGIDPSNAPSLLPRLARIV